MPKISALPAGTTADGTELVAAVQGGATVKLPMGSGANFTQTGTGAVQILQSSIFQDKIFTPEMFSSTVISAAYNTAVASVPDATAAIQAAIDALGAVGGGIVQLGPRAYGVTTVTIPYRNVYIRGAGLNATQIVHKMTSGSTAFYFSAGASILYNTGISDLSILSADTAFNKIAINASDVSEFYVKKVNVAHYPVDGSLYRGSGGAIGKGILVQGRDMGIVEGNQFNAQMPINIAVNPNAATISIDSWVFRDNILVSDLSGATYNVITVDTGVALFNTRFEGHQNWIGGVDGFHWVGSSPTASMGLTLSGIKSEQPGDGGAGFTINIQNSNLSGLKIVDSIAGDRNGIKLRNVLTATIDNWFYAAVGGGAGVVGLNIDSSVIFTEIRNSFWNAGTTATITGQNISQYSNFVSGRSTAISSDVKYTSGTPTEFFQQIAVGAAIIAPPPSGTPTITSPTGTGTMAVTASAPIALNATTGNITITGAAGQVLAGSTPAFTATPLLGVAGSTVGTIGFANATSGSVTVSPPTGALGTVTNTLQAVSDTFVYKATTDELTNKTLTSSVGKGTWTASGTWTLPAITLGGAITYGGVALTNAVTGTGKMVLDNAPTFVGTATAGTYAATSAISLTNNQNGDSQVAISNNNASGSASASFFTSNGTDSVKFSIKGTGASTYGALTAGIANVYSTASFVFMTDAAGKFIAFAPGGNAELARFSASGGMSLNNTTDAGVGGLLGTGAIKSSGATAGHGYATGAGGTVTQGTNRTTGVTLNKVCGAITLFSQVNSAVSGATAQTFTVTNSAVAATDTVIVNQQSGTDSYLTFVTNVAAGSFKITNYTTGGTTNEAPVFNFSVIKGVTS